MSLTCRVELTLNKATFLVSSGSRGRSTTSRDPIPHRQVVLLHHLESKNIRSTVLALYILYVGLMFVLAEMTTCFMLHFQEAKGLISTVLLATWLKGAGAHPPSMVGLKQI